MNIKNLRPDDLSRADLVLFEKTPKTVLFAIAKHLSAASSESYDESLESGAYLERIHEEWTNLHLAGIVPQKPPKAVR